MRTPDGGVRAVHDRVADELDDPAVVLSDDLQRRGPQHVDHLSQVVDVDPTGHLGEPAMSTKPTVVADGP